MHLVEITAYSDEDAYTIFETMNDRLSLLQPICSKVIYWLTSQTLLHVTMLAVLGKREYPNSTISVKEDADAIKAWLRSQYAESIRERKRGATPQDFDLIGTEFHRWVRDHEKQLGIVTSKVFARFIESDFSFYAQQYHRLRKAAETLTPSMEYVYYNAQNNFTLQYPVLLAPLRIKDSEKEILCKIRITAAYLDILIARRIWNFRAIDYSTMQYAMFLVMKEIRGKTENQIAELLTKRLAMETETFVSNDRFYLHGMNKRQIHLLLARMTDYIEIQAGLTSRYAEYVQRSGKNGYEVEHIWANHPERHEDDFKHPNDFLEYRNRVGGLLLLPKSFNASYGDMTYKKKREHYLKQNLLAQSLHEKAYEHNPGFLRFVKTSKLPFQSHVEFKKADLDERQKLYQKLAEQIWNPGRLLEEANA